MNIMNKVAPRDIFNEANFAKSLAQVVRNMQVNDMPGLGMMIRDDADSLKHMFQLDPMDGGMTAEGIVIFHRVNDSSFTLKRTMNARDPYPLILEDEDYGIYALLDNQGDWDSEAMELFEDGPEMIMPNLPDPQRLFTYSLFLKGMGKLSLNAIDGVLPGIRFDEAAYSDNGHLPFEERENNNLSVFTQQGDDGYFSVDGEPVSVRVAQDNDPNNLWPLEIDFGDGEYHPVFDSKGNFQPYITEPELRLRGDFTPVNEAMQPQAPEQDNSPSYDVRRPTR